MAFGALEIERYSLCIDYNTFLEILVVDQAILICIIIFI